MDMRIPIPEVHRLLETFTEKTSNVLLIRCYRNKLLYGCKYVDVVEQEIEKYIEKDPWWKEFID
jgi:hypothetical protein